MYSLTRWIAEIKGYNLEYKPIEFFERTKDNIEGVINNTIRELSSFEINYDNYKEMIIV